MKRLLVWAAALLLAAALGAALFTAWALESSGVAIATTTRADGTARATHVWYVEPGGELWLEAGTPGNPWYLDVLARPELELEIDGVVRAYVPRPVADPAGHDRIRELMRLKYGVRDVWVSLLFDTSRSVAVRLEPL